MKNISDVDKNFIVSTDLGKEDIRFCDVNEEPFTVYGVFYENGKFRRLPERVADKVNDGVRFLHANTAGGRVRFRTDSPYIAIHAEMSGIGKMPHFALTGSAGFDLYVKEDGKEKYVSTFIPAYDMEAGYDSLAEVGEGVMREFTINFPLYSEVKKLYVGVSGNAEILEASAYKNEKPVVFYGSSITQGGCASRPGTSYESILSRTFDTDYINLGFSGSAKGETVISDYICGLDMSVFVYDYDHNAPTYEHLEETHERMFLEIRQAHPDLPVIMMTRPKFILSEDEEKRQSLVRKTYENALAKGDRNVYFIDSRTLMSLAENDGTVDGSHPNDLGFYSMAKAVEKVLSEIL